MGNANLADPLYEITYSVDPVTYKESYMEE
jgi:hypothetical protein